MRELCVNAIINIFLAYKTNAKYIELYLDFSYFTDSNQKILNKGRYIIQLLTLNMTFA